MRKNIEYTRQKDKVPVFKSFQNSLKKKKKKKFEYKLIKEVFSKKFF